MTGRRRWNRRRTFGLVSLLAVIALVIVGLTVPTGSYTVSPGMARSTQDLIQVSGAPVYSAPGAVDLLSVSIRSATPLEAFSAWLNPAIDLRSRRELFGDRSESENREMDLQMMAQSKDAAEFVALERLGYDVGVRGTGALIVTVEADGPSSGVLEPGDTVVAVDGRPITLSNELGALVMMRQPGERVELRLESGANRSSRVVEVTLGARADNTARAYLGVASITRDLEFEFPIEVNIASGRVGGPSAGLAFTLGILDVLTPGSLTGGLAVATTGTIGIDGRVGPVGGVPQKVIAARRAGVDLMLVPSSEFEEARRHAGGLRIESVETISDALAILATVGGGDLVLPARDGASAAA